MNTTTLNMTTLDGGVIIKRGEGGGTTINNQDKVVDITENGTTEVVADGGFTGLGKVTINTEVSGGESGGSSPQPNGYYWKFKFVSLQDNHVSISQLSEQEIDAIFGLYQMQSMATLIHSAFFCSNSIDPTYADNASNIYFNMGAMPYFLDAIGGEIDEKKFNESLLCAWSECNAVIHGADEIFGKSEINFIDIIKYMLLPSMGMEATDENAMMVISEMLMLEPVTKEEYESYIPSL